MSEFSDGRFRYTIGKHDLSPHAGDLENCPNKIEIATLSR